MPARFLGQQEQIMPARGVLEVLAHETILHRAGLLVSCALDILRPVEYIGAMNLLKLSELKKMRPLGGDLESAIMEVLWTKGAMKGRDLHVEIRREKEIAYTTALTVLDRLSKKGFIKKDAESGTIMFSPNISRDVYKNSVAADLVQKAFEVSPDLAISAFAGHISTMAKEDLGRLERLIKEKKNAALK
ncbi:MAG: BlaI/MecI/CopY family transcriptional regulator [Candidatus Aminicenantales bacterium]